MAREEAESVSSVLIRPVRAFVDAVAELVVELTRAAGERPVDDRIRRDVAVDASNIVAGCIDADGVHTDDELRAYLAGVGPHLDTGVVVVTPADVRAAGTIAGRRSGLEHPSELFELLVDADVADGGHRSWVYFRHAMDLAHTVASIDLHTSQAELDLIGRYRAALIGRMEQAGVRRPGAGFFGLHPGAREEAGRRYAPRPARDATAPTAPASKGGVEPEPAALPPPRPLEVLMGELDALVGLEPVKAEVRLVTNLLVVQRLREERGLPTMATSRHLVFTGNPGTGKTTVARLLAEIYRTLGVVERGHLVETDRSELVAGYVGQTAERTRTVIERAVDGMLLIDEAYALARGADTDFGREAIDTLVKMMEDLRERLVVVAAGYPDEMSGFIGANPGLRSRFPRTIHFPDYDDDELTRILVLIAERKHYRVDADGCVAATTWFAAQPRDRGFGNGRLARNLFEAAVARQAARLVELDHPSDDELVTLTAADLAGVSL